MLVFLDRNAIVIDFDFDAVWFLPVLIELIAEYDNGNTHGAADEVNQVALHRLTVLFHVRRAGGSC